MVPPIRGRPMTLGEALRSIDRAAELDARIAGPIPLLRLCGYASPTICRYLTAPNCRRMAEAFTAIADELEARRCPPR